MKKVIYFGAAIVLLASCRMGSKAAVVKTSEAYSTQAILQPKIVDYTVDFNNKVTAVIENKINRKTESAEDVVKLAMINLVEQSKADFIFEPRVSVETLGSKVRATVSGYPAKYTALNSVNIIDTVQTQYYFDQLNMGSGGINTQGMDASSSKRKMKRSLFRR